VDRFVAVCQADERVVAAFLGGSYARGAADVYSDLDLYMVTTDEAYDEFCAERESFIRRLGEPAFLEDFGASHGLFYIFSDGTEGELWLGRESHFQHIHGGAYTVLLDKQGILSGVDFPKHEADPDEQAERLGQLIMVFWHDMLHLIKALGRGQLWFAYGQLEVLRQICLNLARLRHNFADPDIGDEPHFKIEDAMPVEQLAPLQATCCPLEPQAMLQAARTIFRFYRDLAPPLAQRHGLTYPADLEQVMLDHLEKLG
jgi:hypothetical protein